MKSHQRVQRRSRTTPASVHACNTASGQTRATLRSRVPLLLAMVFGGCTSTCSDANHPYVVENPETPQAHELLLAGPPYEQGERSVGDRPSVLELVNHLEQSASRPGIRGLLVRIDSFDGKYAAAQSVANALRHVRKLKPVHCHLSSTDSAGYLVASAGCDHITLTPSGQLNIVGPSLELFYAKQLLEKIDVQAEIFQVGSEKGAADIFTQDTMPEEVRASLNALVGGLHDRLIDAVAERISPDRQAKSPKGGRASDAADPSTSGTMDAALRARALGLINKAPWSAQEAVDAGLIDGVAFLDDARSKLLSASKLPNAATLQQVEWKTHQGEVDLSFLLAMLEGGESQAHPTAPVALVHLQGTIQDGAAPAHAASVSDPFIAHLRALRNNPNVKAVVLRIDSPGGSALASDRMWHAVRALSKRKPVIASVGHMAASGGYYIASAANRIFAQPSSLIGSIGVVGGKVSLQGVMERFGVHTETVQVGNRAGWMSPFRPMSEDERAMFQRELERVYGRFLDRVSVGRGMSKEKVLLGADGKIMDGRTAKSLGLIDELGGLLDALKHARAEVGLHDDLVASPEALQEWPPEPSLLELLSSGPFAQGPALRQHTRLHTRLLQGMMAASGAGGQGSGLDASEQTALGVAAGAFLRTPLTDTLLRAPMQPACVLPTTFSLR